MAEVHAPLLSLPGEGAAESARIFGAGRGWRRRAGVSLLALAVLCVTLEAAGCRVRPSVFVGVLQLSGWGNAQCYSVTGGQCHITDCFAQRKAVCSWGQCTCAAGSCVGADGACHHSQARLLASNFRLRNVQFSDQYLYAPTSFFEYQLRTTASTGTYPDKWDLYELPGLAYTDNHTSFYFLRAAAYSDYVVGVEETALAATGMPGSFYSAVLLNFASRSGFADLSPYNPSLAMSSLCTPAGHADSVIISALAGAAPLYIHHFSWEVFGWVGTNPGAEGYWTPEPPFNFSTPACNTS